MTSASVKAPEVLRSTSFLLVPAYLAAGAYAIVDRGLKWLGEWNATVDSAAGASLLVGPLVAGAVAWDVAALQGPGMRDLSRSTVRGGWTTVRTVMAGAIWGWLSITLLAVVALVATWMTSPVGRPTVWPLVGPIVHIWFGAAVGALAGRFLPALVASPVAVVAVFALLPLELTGYVSNFVEVGGMGSSLAGLTWSFTFLAVAVAIMTFLAAGILVLLSWFDQPRCRQFRVVCGGALVALGVAGNFFLEHSTLGQFTETSAPAAMRCASSHPEVCVSEQTIRMLPWLANDVAESADVLHDAGVEVPQRFEMEVWGREPSDGAGVFFLEEPNRREGDAHLGAEIVTLPTPCAEYVDGPPAEYFESSVSLQQWIMLQRGKADLVSLVNSRDLVWLLRPRSEQLPWVRSTYQSLLSCDLASLTPPWSS